jgi:hypothetical protein
MSHIALQPQPFNYPQAPLHVSETSAHPSTTHFTSTDLKTLQINQTKKANFQRWHIFLYLNNRTAKYTAEKIMKTLSKELGNPGKNTQ